MPFSTDTAPRTLIPFGRNLLLVLSRKPLDTDQLPFSLPPADMAAEAELVLLHVAADRAMLFDPLDGKWNGSVLDTDTEPYHARYDDPSRDLRCVLFDEDGRLIMARPCPICEHRLFDTLAELKTRKAHFAPGAVTQAVA